MPKAVPRNPLVVVLAGLNGAGKTTSAERLLRGALAVEEFVNADAIAGGLSAYHPESAAVAAGRIMLDRLRFLADRRSDFAFETTLSGRGHTRWLAGLRSSGYRVSMLFLSLPDADLAVAPLEGARLVMDENDRDLSQEERFRDIPPESCAR
jgi:predicted ABC-type ATPase